MKASFVYIINPQLFQWDIRWFDNECYIIEVYAANSEASLKVVEPFFAIIGNMKDFQSNRMQSITNMVDIYSDESKEYRNQNGFDFFYGEKVEGNGITSAKHVFKEIPYDPNICGVNQYLLSTEMKTVIYANETFGYVQPIAKSWMYKIQKGSLVSLSSDEKNKGFPHSILYMMVDTCFTPPEIQSVFFKDLFNEDHWDSYLVQESFQIYISRKDPKNPKWNSRFFVECICPLEEFQKNDALRYAITKRKTIFPAIRNHR